ncbi:hypothetical protein [Humibacter sp. RRB41]|uniref:hypothetical protein n=1 Tax=Humibacter sp. RRB41 TaxID=2919946 RepID=UPI001FAA6A1B|nr:hypothetical protein [Humibacter sp. RRB41]
MNIELDVPDGPATRQTPENGPSSIPAARGRIRGLLIWLRSYRGVHYAILVVAALFLLYESRHQGLFYDDWSFVVPDQPSIWAPHVGHWSTVPMLLYLGIRGLFGLNLFLPFAVGVIVAQLGLATLVWRIMLKVGVAPWIATTASALICFLGAGGENVLWAFQVGFIGAAALSLIVMLLLMRERFGIGEAIGVVVLSILALATSGTSLPVLAGAAVVGIVYRGFWRTVALFVPGAVAYGVWFVVVALHTKGNDYHAGGLFQYLTQAPGYVLSMLAGGTGNLVGIAALGAVAFGVMVIWAIYRLPSASRKWTAAYACLLAAVLFAALTAYSRLNLDAATSTRYVFLTTALMLPMGMLALTALQKRLNLPVVGSVVVVALLVAYNFTQLLPILQTRASEVAETSQEFAAAMHLIRSGEGPTDPNLAPAARYAPQVTARELEGMVDKGWLKTGSYDEIALLTVQSSFDVHVTAAREAPANTGTCELAPSGANNIDLGSDASIFASGATQIQYGLTEGTAVARPITVTLSYGWNTIRSTGGDIRLIGVASTVRVCP